MAEEWLTYSDLGERLGISPEAARQKAIRARWPRRTANDGKAQIRVDVADVKAAAPVRKPKDEAPSNDRPTPDENPADTLALAALEAHIETLKAMVAKAEELTAFERQRADGERVRADGERERADRERTRTDELIDRLAAVREEESTSRAALERDVIELRNLLADLQKPRSWWRRLVG